jgi:hypothetical protein
MNTNARYDKTPFFSSWNDVSDKSCGENLNTHILRSVIFFSNNCAVYEIILKFIVNPEMSQIIIRRMRIACWITKATDAHSEYVILIPYPRKQWLHEQPQCYFYTYIRT